MGEKKQKRKGLGGLSPEKKKLLKQLIMQKAAEDLKRQQEEAAAEKRAYIEKIVPKLSIDGLGDADLEKKVRELYAQVCKLEEEKYDWEIKIRKQDFEINELSIKVNDIKGKFAKPMLKKVAKTESRLAKFDKDKLKKSSGAFRDQLKSTGKSKYALEEEDKTDKPEWGKDGLHKHDDKKEGEDDEEAEEGGEEEAGEGEEPAAEEEAQEEEAQEEGEKSAAKEESEEESEEEESEEEEEEEEEE